MYSTESKTQQIYQQLKNGRRRTRKNRLSSARHTEIIQYGQSGGEVLRKDKSSDYAYQIYQRVLAILEQPKYSSLEIADKECQMDIEYYNEQNNRNKVEELEGLLERLPTLIKKVDNLKMWTDQDKDSDTLLKESLAGLEVIMEMEDIPFTAKKTSLAMDNNNNNSNSNSNSNSNNDLPVGWESRADPISGKVYYLDHANKKTQWNKP